MDPWVPEDVSSSSAASASAWATHRRRPTSCGMVLQACSRYPVVTSLRDSVTDFRRCQSMEYGQWGCKILRDYGQDSKSQYVLCGTYALLPPWTVAGLLSAGDVGALERLPVVWDTLRRRIPVLHDYPLPLQPLNNSHTLVQIKSWYNDIPRLYSFHISTMLVGPFRCSGLEPKKLSPSVSYLPTH